MGIGNCHTVTDWKWLNTPASH